MRRSASIPLMMIAMIASLSSAAWADSHEKEGKDGSKQTVTTGQVVGTKVVDASNEQIGTVRDLILNSDGKVLYMITGIGGYAGVLEGRVAIPAQAVTCKCETKDDAQTCHVAVSMTREGLNASPKLESNNHAELIDSNWVTRNNSHFSVTEAGAVPKAGEIYLYSEVKGQAVRCSNGDEYGHISDLVLSPAKGAALYAIIGHGGTLGVGKSFIAVPFSSVKMIRNSENTGWNLSVDQTHAALNALPKVTSPDYVELQNEKNRESIDAGFQGKADGSKKAENQEKRDERKKAREEKKAEDRKPKDRE